MHTHIHGLGARLSRTAYHDMPGGSRPASDGPYSWLRQAQDFTRRAREERLVVRLSNISYGLLEGFLSDNHLLTIMQILNEHMRIIIDDRPPSETFRPVTFESEWLMGGLPACLCHCCLTI
jgi:hypothetical protein